MKTGDCIEIEIHDIAFGGEGVARHEGCVVFVPFAALGDRLGVVLTEKKKHFARGRISKILTPGPGRIPPECRYYGNCGGCCYQHLDYDTQLAVKHKQLRDALQRIGGLGDPEIRPILKSPQSYGYRNRISVHHEDGKIGYRGQDGRSLVDIEECKIAEPEVNRRLRYLRAHPGRREHYSLRAGTIPGEGFYQANRFLLEKLQEQVSVLVTEGAAQVIECYGGSGFFTRPIAARVQRVLMIEGNPKLAAEARLEAPEHVQVREGDCEQVLRELGAEDVEPDCEWLLDPPREGLGEGVRVLLQQLPGQRLIYVSCNPATLARDLKDMASTWTPQWFQPMDLFPQTAHFECVAVCARS